MMQGIWLLGFVALAGSCSAGSSEGDEVDLGHQERPMDGSLEIAPLAGEEWPADTAAVRRLLDAWFSAWEAGDRDGLDSIMVSGAPRVVRPSAAVLLRYEITSLSEIEDGSSWLEDPLVEVGDIMILLLRYYRGLDEPSELLIVAGRPNGKLMVVTYTI
jgi:hypothetical protein